VPDRRIFPAHVTTADEAYAFIKAGRSSSVYLRVDLGDRNEALNKSVTLHPGHEGRIEEVYLSEGIWWKVRIKLIDPPGQHYSCCVITEFNTFWTTDPKEFSKPPPPLSWHERLLSDRLDRLMD
jgi:hypothetical protein